MGVCRCEQGFGGEACESSCRSEYSCPPNWILLGDQCWQAAPTAETAIWEDAQAACVAIGGELARLDTAEQQSYAASLTRGDVWIGLQLAQGSWNDWKWANGAALADPLMWASGKPDESGRCAALRRYGDDAHWIDVPCQSKLSWLCTRDGEEIVESPSVAEKASAGLGFIDMRRLRAAGPCKEPCSVPDRGSVGPPRVGWANQVGALRHPYYTDSQRNAAVENKQYLERRFEIVGSEASHAPTWYMTPQSFSGSVVVSARLGLAVNGVVGLATAVDGPHSIRDGAARMILVRVSAEGAVAVVRVRTDISNEAKWRAFADGTLSSSTGYDVLATTQLKKPANGAFVRVWTSADSVSVHIDGVSVLSASVSDLPNTFNVGVFTYDGEGAVFEDLSVQNTDKLHCGATATYGVYAGETLEVSAGAGLLSDTFGPSGETLNIYVDGAPVIDAPLPVVLKSADGVVAVVHVHVSGALTFNAKDLAAGEYTGNVVVASSLDRCETTVSVHVAERCSVTKPVNYRLSLSDQYQGTGLTLPLPRGSVIAQVKADSATPLRFELLAVVPSMQNAQAMKGEDFLDTLLRVDSTTGEVVVADPRVAGFHPATPWGVQNFQLTVRITNVFGISTDVGVGIAVDDATGTCPADGFQYSDPYGMQVLVGPYPWAPACGGKGFCTPHGTCMCPPQFTGDHCELCAEGRFGQWCAHGRTCVAGTLNDGILGDGQCTCDAGHYGSSCQFTCPGSQSVCSGRGVCSDGTTGDGTCSCSAGYVGDACELSCPGSDEGTECSGHGSCVVDGTQTVCQCDPGYGGRDCSQGAQESPATVHQYAFETASSLGVPTTQGSPVLTSSTAALSFADAAQAGKPSLRLSGSSAGTSSTVFDFSADFTIATWIKLANAVTDGQVGLAAAGTAENGYALTLAPSAGDCAPVLSIHAKGITATATGPSKTTDGWHQVSASYKVHELSTGSLVTTLNVCLDGECIETDGQLSTPIDWMSAGGSFALGSAPGSKGFDGYVAGLELSSSSWSAADAAAAYAFRTAAAEITGLSPAAGSYAGGAELTVSGVSLAPPVGGVGKHLTVHVGGEKCDLTSTAPSTIKCLVPASSSAKLVSTTATVSVQKCDWADAQWKCTELCMLPTCVFEYLPASDTSGLLHDVFHFDSSAASAVYGQDGAQVQETPLQFTTVDGALDFAESPFAANEGSTSAVRTNAKVYSVALRTSPSYVTLSAWVKPSADCVTGVCPIFARREGQIGLLAEAVDGTLSFHVNSESVTASKSLVADQWSYITVRSAPQELTVCVDDTCESNSVAVSSMSSIKLPLSVAGGMLTLDELYVSPRSESDEAIHARYLSYAAASPKAVLSVSGPAHISEGTQLILEVSSNTGIKGQGCSRMCKTGKACGNSCISKSYTCTKPRGSACNSDEVYSWSGVGFDLMSADAETPLDGSAVLKLKHGALLRGRTYLFRVCADVEANPLCTTKEVEVSKGLVLSGVSAVCSSKELCHGESAGVAMQSPWCLSVDSVNVPAADAQVRYFYTKTRDSDWHVGAEQALTAGFVPLGTHCGVLLPAAPGGLTIGAEVKSGSESAVAQTTVYVSHSTVDCSSALTAQSSAEQRLVTAAACGSSTSPISSPSRGASALADGGLLETYVSAAEALRAEGKLPPAPQIAEDLAVLTEKAPPSDVALLTRTVALFSEAIAKWSPGRDADPQWMRASTLRTVSNLQYAADSMSSPAAHQAVDRLFADFLAAEAGSMVPTEATYHTPVGHSGVHTGAAAQFSVSQSHVSTEIDVSCTAGTCPKAILRFGSGAFPGSSQAEVTLISREDNPYASEQQSMAGVVTVKVTHDEGKVPAKAGAGHEVIIACPHCSAAETQNFRCVQLHDGKWQETGVTTLRVDDGKIRCGTESVPVTVSAVYAGGKWVEPIKPTPEPVTIATPAPPTASAPPSDIGGENTTPAPLSTKAPVPATTTQTPTSSSTRVVRVHLSTPVSTFNAPAIVSAVDSICDKIGVSAHLVRRCPVVDGEPQWQLCAAEVNARRADPTDQAQTLADFVLRGPTPVAVDECIVLARIEVEKGAAGIDSIVPNIASASTLVVDPVVGSPAQKTATGTPARLPVNVEDSNASRTLVVVLAAAAAVLLLLVAGAAYFVLFRAKYAGYEDADRGREMAEVGSGASPQSRAAQGSSPRSNAELRRQPPAASTTTFGGVQ
jgi:hypothetical protein